MERPPFSAAYPQRRDSLFCRVHKRLLRTNSPVGAEGEEVTATAENSRKPWSAEEDERLREFAASCATLSEIAEKLNRTEASTKARAYKLRLGLGRFGARRNGAEGEMTFPTHRERQFLQHLRSGGWVKASTAPAGARLIETLLAKGWIERGGLGNESSYRITDQGLAAKKVRVPIYD